MNKDFTPLEGDQAIAIDGLEIDNNDGIMTIAGRVDLRYDEASLRTARQIADLAEATACAIEAGIREGRHSPEQKIETIDDPFELK